MAWATVCVIAIVQFVVGLDASLPIQQLLPMLLCAVLLTPPLGLVLRWMWSRLLPLPVPSRWLWLGGALLGSGLLLSSGLVSAPGMIDEHRLEIVATGEKRPESEGSEVWIRGINHMYEPARPSVPLAELSSEGGWSQGVGKRLISADEQPAALRWEGRTRGIDLVFETSAFGGKVLVRWDGGEVESLDLYNPYDSVLRMTLVSERSKTVGLLLRSLDVVVFAFALLFLSLACVWAAWVWPFPRKEDTLVTIDGVRRTIQILRQDGIEHWIWLGTIVVAAVVFRALCLALPMRADESYTALNYVMVPFLDSFSNYMPNNHVFHTVLVRAVCWLFGTGSSALRMPAFIAGTLMVPATYALGRVYYNKWVGLLSAGLVATSSHMLTYSANARGYSLVGLCFVLLAVLAAGLCRRANRWLWIAFAAISVIGFYTIPTFLYPYATVSVWLFASILIRQKDRHSQRKLLGYLITFSVLIALCTVLLYLPILMRSGVADVTANPFVASLSWKEFVARIIPTGVSTWRLFQAGVPFFGVVLSATAFVVGLFCHWQLSRYMIPWAIACCTACVPLVLIQRVVAPERVWTFVIPVYACTVAAGVYYLFARLDVRANKGWSSRVWSVLALAVSLSIGVHVWCTGGVYTSAEAEVFPHVHDVIRFLKDYVRPDDNLFSISQPTVEYYFEEGQYAPPRWGRQEIRNAHRIIVVAKKGSIDGYVADQLERTGMCYPGCDEVPWVEIKHFGNMIIYEYSPVSGKGSIPE